LTAAGVNAGPPAADAEPPAAASQLACGICALHGDAAALARDRIWQDATWLLRHHPAPAPLAGWLLLDSRRHLGGPADFEAAEAAAFGPVLQRASALVRSLTGCQRVYAIAFGEGARHLHLHLIPRHADDPASEAWKAADLYRAVAAGQRPAADPAVVAHLVARGRQLTAAW